MASSEADVAQEHGWIRRAQKGDGEAFEPLVRKYQQRVFSIVYHLVRRRDEVEDLVQEIFIKAFRAMRSYNFQASFGTWLSRIATNHCYDYLRHQRSTRVSYYWQLGEDAERELEASAEGLSEQGSDHVEQAALREIVDKLLERAPEKDRTILVLKELEDYSVEEIASILNLKPGAVKVRLHRARKRMLVDLKRWQEGGR
jgi:RNA polymerase sigma-70 factor (ECF subfamily)